jgi:predicted ArsR family transcriptional regulator
MKTTRQRLLEILHERHSVTVNELSRLLRVTPANVRHHLEVLVSEGVIEMMGRKPSHGPGRPVQVYGLTRQASSHNLDGLAKALFKTLDKTAKQDAQNQPMQDLAEMLAITTEPMPTSPTQKLSRTVQRLNEMNYHARWEAAAQGPRIVFSHCPYATILSDHPELCKVDRLMLEAFLGQQVHQTARLELGSQGLPQCVFLLKE